MSIHHYISTHDRKWGLAQSVPFNYFCNSRPAPQCALKSHLCILHPFFQSCPLSVFSDIDHMSDETTWKKTTCHLSMRCCKGPPSDSWSSSLTWSCSSKYIWVRSVVQCLMTPFIFWARHPCCSCLTMCTCPVSCYLINTLIHGSAACCVCVSPADNSPAASSWSSAVRTPWSSRSMTFMGLVWTLGLPYRCTG